MAYDQALDLARRLSQWSRALRPAEDSVFEDWMENPPHTSTDATMRAQAYDDFMDSRRTLHTSKGIEDLHKFFDYRISHMTERNHHQYALLSLANAHYDDGAYMSARAALEEAIRISKQSSDKDCLGSCHALLQRLNFYQPEGRPIAQTSKSEVFAHANDELWKIREQIRDGMPVPHLFSHLYRSKSLLLPESVGFKAGQYRLRWDATSSELWDLLGSRALAEIHSDLGAEDFDIDRDPRHVRGAVTVSKAIQHAHIGRYEAALSLLLVPILSPLAVLSKAEIEDLHSTFWAVWRLRAERGEFTHLLASINRNDALDMEQRSTYIYRKSAVGNLLCLPYANKNGFEDKARLKLARAQKFKECDQPALALEPILEVLESTDLPTRLSSLSLPNTDRKGFNRLHMLAKVMLADVEVECGAPNKAEGDVNSVWLQILTSGDPELQAYANWTKARCIVAQSEKHDRLEESLPYFQRASEAYEQLGCYPLHADVLSDMAVVFDYLGKGSHRDATAAKWQAVTEKRAKHALEDQLLKELEEMAQWLAESIARSSVVKCRTQEAIY